MISTKEEKAAEKFIKKECKDDPCEDCEEGIDYKHFCVNCRVNKSFLAGVAWAYAHPNCKYYDPAAYKGCKIRMDARADYKDEGCPGLALSPTLNRAILRKKKEAKK